MLAYGLAAGWTLDEALGAVRSDILGKYHLTVTASNVQRAAGKVGGAARYVNTGGSLSNLTQGCPLNNPLAMTMSCWYNRTGTNTAIILMGSVREGSTAQFLSINTASNIPIVQLSTAGAATTLGTAFTVGTWNHLAFTFDGTRTPTLLKVYQNGLMTAVAYAKTADMSQAESTVSIGSAVGGAGVVLIDEAYMWNRALNDAEIANIYRLGNVGISYPWGDGRACG